MDPPLEQRSIGDEAFYEWLLSDHPMAAAERARRRREHYLRRDAQRAEIRELIDHWTPEVSQRLFALRESMRRFADRWEAVCDEWLEGETVDVEAVRARLTLQRRDRGDAGYRYPDRYRGSRAAASPPPPAQEPSGLLLQLEQTADREFLYERFGIDPGPVAPRLRVRPTQALLGLEQTARGVGMREMRWRPDEILAETALGGSAAVGPRRVVVPADSVRALGREQGGGRPALAIRRGDRDVLSLAGIEDAGGVAVLTVAADSRFGRRGQRMPLILEPDEESEWLDGGLDAGRLAAILARPRSFAELSVLPAGAG
ncbi:MAG TPA: SOS response-associated peptidase family protein [Candidatus Dormibacteraeota bacterium]